MNVEEVCVVFELAPCYSAKAKRERDDLDWRVTSLLHASIRSAVEDAALMCHLHQIDKRMRELGMERAELAGHFEQLTPGAVSKWFTTGQISSTRYAHLIALPMFKDLRPTDEEVREHAARCAITWIRRSIVRNTPRVKVLKYGDLHYLAALHSIDDEDMSSANAALPSRLAFLFGKRTAGQLYTLLDEWGKAYRLFVGEIKNAS